MAGRSIVSNSVRRLTPMRRISRPFMRSIAAVIAVLHSASEKCQCRVNSPQKCRLKIPHSDAQRPVLCGGQPPA